MTLRIGELSSQVDVQGEGGGGGGQGAGGTGAAPPLHPTWLDRERHRRLAEIERCDRDRVAGEGFGA